ncbi:MAG: MATE family efflux transporter, partial [Lachnospiraceae bacterium]|nr:MATE family efflux transporter [Lachnospiraceae bacterium]
GMKGAALAPGLSPVVSMLSCMIHYLSANNTIRFRPVRPALRPLLNACRLGTSYFIGEIASGLTMTAYNYILLGLAGNVAVAAYGVVANLALVATAIFNGISQGQQPVISELYAQNNRDGVKRAERHSLQISLGVAVALLVCILVFANEVAEIFNSEHSAVLARYATQGLRIYFTGFLFAAVNIVRAGYFSAVNAPGKSFVISISRGVVSIIAFAFLLSRLWGIYGVWLSFPAAELFTLLISGR